MRGCATLILCPHHHTSVPRVTALASDSLKEESLDHTPASKIIDGVFHILQTMKSEEQFEDICGGDSKRSESPNIPVVSGQKRIFNT